MNKNPGIKKSLLLITFILFAYLFTNAQSNSISISVTGIEYDDPSYSLLKESLQKNKNVSSLKTGYDNGTAKISMNYNRTAQNLWDEIPQTTKQFFKIATLNDNSIVLESKNAMKENQVSNTNKASNTNQNDNDCKNCYWNMCKYDVIKSIGGKIYKGVITETGTVYYNCDNGIVLATSLNINAYGSTVISRTDTLLISNAPIGTIWGVSQTSTHFLGVESSNFVKNTLVGKGVTVTVNGKTYKDVLVVNYYYKSHDNFIAGDEAVSLNRYYAKGAGLIKEEKLIPDSDPGAKEPEVIKPVGPVVKTVPVKGRYDPSLVGTWKYEQGATIIYWKFNQDGTYDLYTGSITPANSSKGKCYWAFDNGVFTTNCEGGSSNRYDFEKKNDPKTGKPTIVVNSYVYTSADNKMPW